MKGSPVGSVELSGRSASAAGFSPRQILAVAALVAVVLFGLAGVIGAIGYLVSASRYR